MFHKSTIYRMGLAIALALVSFGPLSQAVAGTNVWTDGGPDGGSVSALALDPLTPATIYAGTYTGGVFKTTDAGVTWNAATTAWPTSMFLRSP